MSMRPQEPRLPQPKNFMIPEPEVIAASSDEPVLKMSDLTETERSAASLGVDPQSWRPIGFINQAHYESLLRENKIDSELVKRVEAFKHVAAGASTA